MECLKLRYNEILAELVRRNGKATDHPEGVHTILNEVCPLSCSFAARITTTVEGGVLKGFTNSTKGNCVQES